MNEGLDYIVIIRGTVVSIIPVLYWLQHTTVTFRLSLSYPVLPNPTIQPSLLADLPTPFVPYPLNFFPIVLPLCSLGLWFVSVPGADTSLQASLEYPQSLGKEKATSYKQLLFWSLDLTWRESG